MLAQPNSPNSPNSSFSTQLPSLQLAIDSTSLGAFKKCPRYLPALNMSKDGLPALNPST